MSLSASLNNALSGLGLSARRAEIISSNVANADTPGYARRRLSTGGPVTGVPSGNLQVGREVDPALQFLRRDAQSKAANTSIAQSFNSRLDIAIGDPGQSGSLQDFLSRLDAAFTSAAADPTSLTRLATIARSAEDVAVKLNTLADLVTSERQAAETSISQTVDRVNADLGAVSRLNVDILRMRATGNDPSNLLDQRQLLVDRISEDIPIRQLHRDNGTIALVSQGGVILLDGRPAQIAFDARTMIQPDMTYPDQLAGLTVNGKPAGTGEQGDGLAGGRLGGLFSLRDRSATTAMNRLDAFATDIAVRLQAHSTDPTLGATEPGLFTDGGLRVDSAAATGLAGRIQVNDRVRPGQDPELWRFRDGLAASTEGPLSDPSQILRFGKALRKVDPPISDALGGDAGDMVSLGARLRSAVSLDRLQSDDAHERASGQASALLEMRDGGKVDVDEEMRRLIEVEQAYAANARLVQAVGQMMDRLTEI